MGLTTNLLGARWEVEVEVEVEMAKGLQLWSEEEFCVCKIDKKVVRPVGLVAILLYTKPLSQG